MHVRELRSGYRAKLFSALLALSDKQGSWDEALQLLNQGRQVARRAQLQELVDQFEKGQESVFEQLKGLGQFLPWELVLIELGLATGNINSIFTRLRDHYILQQQFYQELKRQLKLPLMIIMIILVGVLMWSHSEQGLGVISLTIRFVLSISAIACLAWLVNGVCLLYRAGVLPPWLLFVFKLVPGIRGLILRGQTFHYLRNLQQCTESGLPLEQSLGLSATQIPDTRSISSYMKVHDAVKNGQKLSVALLSCGILEGVTIEPIKKENASAADAQQHICEAAYHSYIEYLWSWAGWLPQLLYVLLPFVALANLLTI